MQPTLQADLLSPILSSLETANRAFLATYPGDSGDRQPVHTVYGGAQLFTHDTAVKLGEKARAAMAEFGADPSVFLGALEPHAPLDHDFATRLHSRVKDKLEKEPVEDFRIDFEDGYGNRPDAEEDGHAVQAAQEVIKGHQAGTLPPFIGIRLKPFNDELKARSIRTLDLFLTTLVKESGGDLPKPFYITLPKVTVPEQAKALAELLTHLEKALDVPLRTFEVELMIETPQSIFNQDGDVPLLRMVAATQGRCRGAHFGTYDYTAYCKITAAYQDMLHPACDFARDVMQVALAGTGVWISDGATNILPVAPHRGELTPAQKDENTMVVHDAWRLHYEHVQSSLRKAYYQGWDLHPGQLPTRYAAIYGFFLKGLDAAGERLRNFVSKAAQATLVGDVFDDAATGQGLLNFFLKALNCGAITEEEALKCTSLTLDELHSRSFLKILENRRG
ncbi:MAG: phosphoenolpyruvate kinase [Candidatus Eremiobacteraeota bacterium]|nr:phosphoenolpyruvate kinase [Candidatus Eremiobacteraeota bacterium]